MNIGVGSFNGLTFGTGTKYQVTKVKGIEDMPPVINSDARRGNAHGSYRGLDFLDERTVELDFFIKGTDNADYVALVDAFNIAFSDQQANDLPFLWADSTKLLNGTCRGRFHDYDARWAASWGTAHVRLDCADPRLYDAALNTQVLAVPAITGGLTWPLSWNLSWGSAVSGAANLVNSGSIETPPIITFTGPLTNPFITKNSPGVAQTLSFAIDLLGGDTLVIDTDGKTATLNGSGNRLNTISTGSQWWVLVPGTSQVSFGASAGSGNASVSWRSARQ